MFFVIDFIYLFCICCLQEGAFALAFKSVHFPGEIVVARYAVLHYTDLNRLIFNLLYLFTYSSKQVSLIELNE